VRWGCDTIVFQVGASRITLIKSPLIEGEDKGIFMSDFKIGNITFTLDSDIGVTFSYNEWFNENKFGAATLQLPSTPDSCDTINDQELDSDSDEHQAVFEQLKNYYFDDFKNVECAAASALLGDRVIHVQEVDNLYIAFVVGGLFAIKESIYRDYYNKQALFSRIDESDLPISECESFDLSELFKKSEDCFTESLSSSLKKKMQVYLDEIIKDESNIFDNKSVDQCFDDILFDFMKSEFGSDYEKNDFASEFYQMTACDIRVDFEREAKDYLLLVEGSVS
jgi:hypothetical protein